MTKILPLIPEHKIFVDVFTGSGTVFFNKPLAETNIINDLDDYVYDFLKLIQEHGSVSSDRIFKTIDDIKEFYKSEPESISDKLIYKKVLCSTGYRGNKIRHIDMIYNNFNINNYLAGLDIYKELLRHATITNLDFETVINNYNTEDTFFYLDPPYEHSTIKFGYAEHKSFNYERFKTVIDTIKGKFLISLNDSEYIRNLFKDYKIESIIVHDEIIHRDRKELFIRNY